MAKKRNHNLLISELLPTALGCWQVFHDNLSLYRLSWLGWVSEQTPGLSDLSYNIKHAIDAYVDTGRIDFDDLPICLQVSPFQRSVLAQLSQIPCGQTKTYGDIAFILNTSARAVGQACRSNPIPFFIPCHRIVSKTGIGGYMGAQNRTDLKSFLLTHESKLASCN